MDDHDDVPTTRGRSDDDDDAPDDVTPPRLLVGEPFALAYDCALRDDNRDNTSSLVVECKCGKAFRMLLLQAGNKPCPHCGAEYTHLLLVCSVDNDQAFNGVLEQIADVNPIDGDGNPVDDEDDASPHRVFRGRDGDDDEGDDDEGDEGPE